MREVLHHVYRSDILQRRFLFRPQSGLRIFLRRARDDHAAQLPDPPARRRARPALCHDRHGAYPKRLPALLRRGQREGPVHRGAELCGQRGLPARHAGRGLGAAVRAHPVAARHVRHGRRGTQCARARGRGQHTVCARAAVRAAALARRRPQRLHRGRGHGGRPARL